MTLSAGDRALTSAELQRRWSSPPLPCSITKPDLGNAVDAIDAWCDANQASFNAALPLPARTSLTADQKSWLLCYVVRKRIADVI